jgi:4-amino-4-deoxy-L-arabinose transferase-like glycosyltransferase
MFSRGRILRAVAWFIAVSITACASWRALGPHGIQPVPLEVHAGWITTANAESAVAHFRKVVVLSSSVRSAWIAVSGREGYEVVINGATAGRSLLFRPTRAFQTGLSERGQRIVTQPPLLGGTFPREYQWAGHSNERMPVFFDIAPFLSRGKNAICIEVETRVAPPKVRLEGEILLWSGERVRLQSDATFKVAPASSSLGRTWTENDYVDLDWPSAVVSEEPTSPPLRIVDPGVFGEAFAGRWLRAPEVSGAVWFETTWHVEGRPEEAWVRVLTNRPFELFVNEHPVRVADAGPHGLDGGEWIIGRRSSIDAPAVAESLDPDEVGTLFTGPRFAAGGRRAGDRDVGEEFDSEALLRGTSIDAPSSQPAPEPGGAGVDSFGPAQDRVAPKELAKSREDAVYYAYAVQQLLASGDNHIAIRLSAPDGPNSPAWSPKLAVDGRATWEGGVTWLESDATTGWTARAQAADGQLSDAERAIVSGAASAPETELPRMQYRGFAECSSGTFWLSVIASLALAAAGLALLGALPRGLRWARTKLAARWGLPALADESIDEAMWVVAPSCAWLLAALAVDLSWGERDETIVLLSSSTWRLILLGAALLGGASAIARLLASGATFSLTRFVADLPRRRGWAVLLTAALALTAVLRVHAMHRQPLDDDELASTQAALAVARTGLPRYSEDVYYTRGPLYHYVAGASAWIGGETVAAVRFPSVAFAVATALLIYAFGARILGSRWSGLIGVLLYSIHPYAIFAGHLARFYQQQQFFTLATVYFFCRGFVTEQRISSRYLCVLAFFLACLSQELSVVLVPPLLLAYAVLAKKKDLRQEPSLVIAAGCVALLIGVDILVFQTRCLTKLQGISPNVEATLALHFTNPMNLAALFISHSRLHLVLSLLLAAGLPLLVAQGRGPRALLLFLFAGSLSTHLLVTGESLRYQYWLFPMWILAGVHAVRALVLRIAKEDGLLPPFDLGRQWIAPLVGVLGIGAVVLSLSPWRIPGSYAATLLGDSAAAFGYVRTNLREGDKVAATEPHAHAGLIELGRIDYDVAVPLLQDFVYQKHGKLIDRNGSAEVVSTLEQLKEVLSRNDRVWLIVNREKFRSRGQDIRWEYPAARFELFLRRNLEIKFQSYLWTVFLWDARSGRFHSLPETALISWSGGI